MSLIRNQNKTKQMQHFWDIKGPLSGLRQFKIIESALKVIKNTMFNFKIYGATDYTINNYNVHIAQYLKK